jgi:diacylglycerol kinase (ATP)
MKIAIIHNPDAGKGDLTGNALRNLCADAGHEVVFASTNADSWESLFSQSPDRIIIAGGDGTVHRVVPYLAKEKIPFYILPIGTANNIAACLNQVGFLTERIAQLANARPRRLDLGWISMDSERRSFVEAVGVGILAELMDMLSQEKTEINRLDSPPKKLGFALDTLLWLCDEYAGVDCEFSLNGEKRSGRYLLVEVMNMSSVGPCLTLAPDADPGDGYLDLICVTDEQRLLFRSYVERLKSGGPMNAPFDGGRCSELQLGSVGEFVHIDGEVFDSDQGSLSIRIEPGALTYLEMPTERTI